MENTFLGRWMIALQHARKQKQFPFIYNFLCTILDPLIKKKRPTSLRVVHKKKLSPPLKDDRARLFIVKPRSGKKLNN